LKTGVSKRHNVRSGVFSLPTGLKGIVSGQYFIQSSETGSRNVILSEGDRLTGLHRPIAIRGGEPGDVIFVHSIYAHSSAELRFGDEIGDENDTDTAALPNYSSVNEDSRSSAIAGIDLAGNDNDKQWKPISTAPMEKNLEVRLEDAFGRYVLLFPCKLIPGEGWINGWLETTLAVHPVEWRYWDEASIRF
jgi:hypothetical protein